MFDDLSGVSLRLIENIDDVMALKRWMSERRSVLGVDTETTGLDWWRERTRLAQFGDAMTGWAIPMPAWQGVVKELLEAYDRPVVFHNAKFDLHFFANDGITVRRSLVHDTQPMAHLTDSASPKGLKSLAARLVNTRAVAGEQVLKNAMGSRNWTWANVPADFGPYWHYAALDPVLTARLYDKLMPQVLADGYHSLYETEIESQLVIMDAERRGIRISNDYVNRRGPEIAAQIEAHVNWIMAEFGVENPGSNQQVITRLHADGQRWTKRTESGNVSLDESVLATLDHPLAKAILDYREMDKLVNTYISNFRDFADGDVLHASIHPLGARTGRMSVSRPSLQNVPRSADPRDAFIAREGNKLVLIDYDQVELRLLAHFAGEPSMIEAIHAGVDLHTRTAQLVYGLGDEQPTSKQRQVAKNANFAKIYGSGAATFAKTARITLGEAAAFNERYDATYPNVRAFMHSVESVARRRAKESGSAYVRTPAGRVHRTDSNTIYRLVNYLIQGCLPPWTRVLTRDGWKQIFDFVDGEDTWTGERWASATLVSRGPARLVKLHLEDGRMFECDERHKLLANTDAPWPEWKAILELEVGDALVADRRIDDWGAAFKTVEDWYWFGRFIGDGHLSPSNGTWGMAFDPDEQDDVDRFTAWLDVQNIRGLTSSTCGYNLSRRDSSKGINYIFQVTGGTKRGREMWQSFGFQIGWKSATKRLPNAVFTLDRARRQAVYDGYYAADGKKKGGHRVKFGRYIASVNRPLLEDTSKLYTTIGGHAIIRKTQMRGKTYYELHEWKTHHDVRVARVELTEQVEEMFTLAVDDERHAFSSEGLISKNTAADILKQKLVDLDNAGLTRHFVLPVHDEFIFDVPDDEVTEFAAEAQEVIQDLTTFSVPLSAGVDIYQSWGDKYRDD